MPGDKATRERFALLDFDIPPAKAETPAPDPNANAQQALDDATRRAIADQQMQANANAQQYAMLQAMQNQPMQNAFNPYQQGLGGAQDFGNSLQNIQANALYGYAPIYPELAARIISDQPAPELSALDRLRYALAGRTPPK